MIFEWLIARRYLVPKRSWMVLIITTLSVVGGAVGVASLITVLSVMGGFASDLREKIVATKAHVVVSAERGHLPDSESILELVNRQPYITGAAAYIESEVMISTSSSADGIVLRGIDLATIGNTSNLPESIQEGHLEWLEDPGSALESFRSFRTNRASTDPFLSAFESETNSRLSSEADNDKLEREGTGQPEPTAAEGTGFVMPTIRGNPGHGSTGRSNSTAPPPDEGSGLALRELPEPTFTGDFEMPSIPGQNTTDQVMPDLPFAPPIPQTTSNLPGIVIGTELGERLHVAVGSEVTIISPDGQLLPTGPAPLSRPYLVVGTFYTGMYEFDTRFAYVTMPEARDILRVPEGYVTAIDIKVSDLDFATQVATTLGSALSDHSETPPLVRSWDELNKGLFSALKLEKIAIFVILIIIILVASFSIVSNLIIMVVERTSEIAILKSMGTTNRSIMRIFGIQGGLIGLVGTVLGVLVGVGICLFIRSGGIPLDTGVYYIEYLPVDLQVQEVVVTALAAIGISLLATVYPALKATRIGPAEGLRHD